MWMSSCTVTWCLCGGSVDKEPQTLSALLTVDSVDFIFGRWPLRDVSALNTVGQKTQGEHDGRCDVSCARYPSTPRPRRQP